MMRRLAVLGALACLLGGCVAVRNTHGIVPPTGTVANFTAPLVVPNAPIPCRDLKIGKGQRSLYVKEWLYSGASVEVCNMALEDAIAAGGIRELLFADYHQYSIFGFVTVFSVTAYGK